MIDQTIEKINHYIFGMTEEEFSLHPNNSCDSIKQEWFKAEKKRLLAVYLFFFPLMLLIHLGDAFNHMMIRLSL